MANIQAFPARTSGLDREVLCMGTRLGLHLQGPRRDQLQQASTRMLEEIDRIEQACSTWRPDSLWSRLNGARGAAVPLEREWLLLLASAQAWQQTTQGAFDPVLLALLRAWDPGSAATETEQAQARAASGSGLLRLDLTAGTARLDHPQAGVEGAGFVKGYALDAALRLALELGVASGWLDFGGQLLTWGRSRQVAVADPGDRARPRIQLRLPEAFSLASSGCSERGRHLLDPRAGRPCPDWGAVAVVASSGLEAEMLSTALYVKGPGDGPPWAAAQGVAAAFLPHRGEVIQTPGFQALESRVSGAKP